jgi:hypothetical protein
MQRILRCEYAERGRAREGLAAAPQVSVFVLLYSSKASKLSTWPSSGRKTSARWSRHAFSPACAQSASVCQCLLSVHRVSSSLEYIMKKEASNYNIVHRLLEILQLFCQIYYD